RRFLSYRGASQERWTNRSQTHDQGRSPVDGFWSISVYGADGYFHVNDQNTYNINGTTAKKDADGSITIQFGGCDGTTPNCIPITSGWNYWARFYRPRKEILNGTYKFPVPL